MSYLPWNYSKPYSNTLFWGLKSANKRCQKACCQWYPLEQADAAALRLSAWAPAIPGRGPKRRVQESKCKETRGKHQSVVSLAIFGRYSKNLCVGCVHSVPHQSVVWSVVWICTWTWPERTPAIRVQSIDNSPYKRLGHGLKARKLRSKKRTPSPNVEVHSPQKIVGVDGRYPLVISHMENHHFFMGKSTISMAMFNSKLLVYRRVWIHLQLQVPTSIYTHRLLQAPGQPTMARRVRRACEKSQGQLPLMSGLTCADSWVRHHLKRPQMLVGSVGN